MKYITQGRIYKHNARKIETSKAPKITHVAANAQSDHQWHALRWRSKELSNLA